MFNYLTYLYVSLKPQTMIYLFIFQVLLFSVLIAFVGKLFINLLIDKQ